MAFYVQIILQQHRLTESIQRRVKERKKRGVGICFSYINPAMRKWVKGVHRVHHAALGSGKKGMMGVTRLVCFFFFLFCLSFVLSLFGSSFSSFLPIHFLFHFNLLLSHSTSSLSLNLNQKHSKSLSQMFSVFFCCCYFVIIIQIVHWLALFQFSIYYPGRSENRLRKLLHPLIRNPKITWHRWWKVWLILKR